MEFFTSAIDVLQTLVIALGAGLGVWGGHQSTGRICQLQPERECSCAIKKHKTNDSQQTTIPKCFTLYFFRYTIYIYIRYTVWCDMSTGGTVHEY